jgi:hypothetical protein
MNINELCKHFLKLIYNFFPLNSLGRTADNHFTNNKDAHVYRTIIKRMPCYFAKLFCEVLKTTGKVLKNCLDL